MSYLKRQASYIDVIEIILSAQKKVGEEITVNLK